MPTKKERREALDRMTKAELVKTVVALDARQTKLLNQIAGMQVRAALAELPPSTSEVFADPGDQSVGPFPWEQE